MRKVVFDLEADSLWPTKIWCIVAKDIKTDEVFTWEPDTVSDFADWARDNVSILIGHNIIGYDLPHLSRLIGLDWPLDKVVDTVVVSRLLDSQEKRHSLEAHGERLNYPKVEHDEWDRYSPEMLNRCTEDVHLNHLVFDDLVKKIEEQGLPREVSRQEHLIAQMCQDIYSNGWKFDEQKAHLLLAELLSRQAELEEELNKTFIPLPQEVKVVEPKYKQDGSLSIVGLKHLGDHWTDVEGDHSKIVWQETNLASKQFLFRHLQMMGWKPTQFTEAGNPLMTEWVMEQLGETLPEAAPLVEWDMVRRRIAMVTTWIDSVGAVGWVGRKPNRKPTTYLKGDDRVHGSIYHIGTWTQRPSHSDPNMAQVPACDKPYGSECRALWTVGDGYKLVGCDASGIQLRMLAHYIGDPVYTAEVVDGDIHTHHLNAIGEGTRDNAKTFIYAFLLGAGGPKIGSIYGKGGKYGNKLKYEFLNRIPALKTMKYKYEAAAEAGYIIGLDGRRIPVSDPYYTMAALLQGGETVLMRRAMKLWTERSGHIDYSLLGWIHDEWQTEVKEEQAEEFGKIQRQSIIDAGVELNLRCPMDGEFKVGSNWKETH